MLALEREEKKLFLNMLFNVGSAEEEEEEPVKLQRPNWKQRASVRSKMAYEKHFNELREREKQNASEVG